MNRKVTKRATLTLSMLVALAASTNAMAGPLLGIILGLASLVPCAAAVIPIATPFMAGACIASGGLAMIGTFIPSP